MNPGHSVKDRAALGIVTDAIAQGPARPGGLIVDGTGGKYGHRPRHRRQCAGHARRSSSSRETQSQEKKDTHPHARRGSCWKFPRCRTRPQQLCEGRRADRRAAGVANIPRARSGPTSSTMSPTATSMSAPPARKSGSRPTARSTASVSAVGTGGTLAGVAEALRERNPDVVIALADVPGAALYSYFRPAR